MILDRQKGKKRELILGKHDIIMVLSKNVKTRSQSKLADWLFVIENPQIVWGFRKALAMSRQKTPFNI